MRAALAAVLVLAACATPAAAQPISLSAPAAFALVVDDGAAMAAWYAETFGLEETRRHEMATGVVVILLRSDTMAVELIDAPNALDPLSVDPEITRRSQVRGHFKAGVFVADAEAAHAILTALRRDIDARVFSDEDWAGFFNLRDPEGNTIQVFQRR